MINHIAITRHHQGWPRNRTTLSSRTYNNQIHSHSSSEKTWAAIANARHILQAFHHMLCFFPSVKLHVISEWNAPTKSPHHQQQHTRCSFVVEVLNDAFFFSPTKYLPRWSTSSNITDPLVLWNQGEETLPKLMMSATK